MWWYTKKKNHKNAAQKRRHNRLHTKLMWRRHAEEERYERINQCYEDNATANRWRERYNIEEEEEDDDYEQEQETGRYDDGAWEIMPILKIGDAP